MSNNREQWGSRLGFILAASGSAVGIGNIWKFPYIAGENGGAAFTIVYLACIMIVGLSILVAEFVIELEADSPKDAKKFLKHWANGEIIDDETYEVIDESTSYNLWLFDKALLPKDWKFEIKQPKKVATGWRNFILYNRK